MACTFAVDPQRLQAGLSVEQVLALAPPEEQFWIASSRSGWYQGLLERALAVYPGFSALEFLLRDLTAISGEQARLGAGLLRDFMEAIVADPQPFSRLDYTEDNHDEIRRQVAEAQVLRSLDDDSRLAHSNFFSYVLSQSAALQQAAEAGLAVVMVQLGPSPPEGGLIWPPV